MRQAIIVLILCVWPVGLFSQISEMKWELDYEIFLKLSNDSSYSYDIRRLFHVTNSNEEFSSDFVFYPVNPGKEFANEVKGIPNVNDNYFTLWSALHAKIGGGWIHFSNCIAFALEMGYLDIKAPLMKRPQTGWKPDPVTESYRRTNGWEYYVPVNQKEGQKEFLARVRTKDIADINSLPESYLELYLNTSDKDYESLRTSGRKAEVAKIDLVNIILGSKFLGEAQINYMSNAILESVLSYTSNRLPSVIIFDEFDAAAAMTLNAQGYKIENIVYRSAANITVEEAAMRNEQIEQIVKKINDYNRNSFKKWLGNYYQ